MGTVFQKVTEKLTDSHAKGSGLYEAVFIPPYGSQARPQDQPQELLISDTNNWDQFQEKEEPDRSPPPRFPQKTQGSQNAEEVTFVFRECPSLPFLCPCSLVTESLAPLPKPPCHSTLSTKGTM